ncbi:E3 ubiquitin-protein ligase MBR1 [Frankliniella fusca]|uniref:E3 ubiquitin-protein ligase MBR1 n=1 Tax=Frankliniella fusca TaxID=407009 RepID=A0AAE1HQ56_9NEOP|nr:E3 ubiquitin-protein ligase MBR1 [Frankliniella fusca]
MPSPPLMLLCAAGVGLAALLYYYFASREQEVAASYGAGAGAGPRNRRRSRNGTRYEVEECSICQDLVLSPPSLRTLACGHSFHRRCIEKWQEVNLFALLLPILQHVLTAGNRYNFVKPDSDVTYVAKALFDSEF